MVTRITELSRYRTYDSIYIPFKMAIYFYHLADSMTIYEISEAVMELLEVEANISD